MIAALVNHLWQSTLVALMAGGLTIAFRNNRARVRYWLWLSASLKFLLPFSLLLTLGSRVVPARGHTPIQATPIASASLLQVAQPISSALVLPQPSRDPNNWMPNAAVGIWACGFLGVALIRFRSYRRISAAISASSRIDNSQAAEVRSSPALLEPGVFGFWRPVLLLPQDIEKRLTPAQFQAVLAHELCHIRRNDNLTAGLHMIVEALFWFHPLVWWIGAKLLNERERACDETVLSLGSEPRDYAEGILSVCKHYLESPMQAFSGITGSDLKGRIHAILGGCVARELNRTKKAALAIAVAVVLVAPIIIGIINAPAIRAQSTEQHFEVASLKPNPGCENIPTKGNLSPSPGRLELPCATLQGFIMLAYGTFRDGSTINSEFLHIEGGPAWTKSEYYGLAAKADGPLRTEMLAGPMLKAFLEERFQLKTHREMRDAPVYAMTVAKGGLKVQPLPPGGCTPIDLTHPPELPKPGDPLPNLCGAMLMKPTQSGTLLVDFRGSTLTQLAQRLSPRADRTIVDETGISGLFNFHLEFAPNPINPGQAGPFRREGDRSADPPADSGPDLYAALQEQLGLKLSPEKGLVGVLIIDHAEKPSAN